MQHYRIVEKLVIKQAVAYALAIDYYTTVI